MTVGIYALIWNNNYDAIYIGQSINIEYRYKQHIDLLKSNTHYNYKIVNTSIKNGIPELLLIEDVQDTSSLNEKEIFWMKEFDTVNSGMNITSGGVAGRGLQHSNSKYSKNTLLKVFSLLYRTTITYQNVATRCGVSKYIVHNIVSGVHHLWLKDEYPEKFKLMIKNKVLRSNINLKTYANSGKKHLPLVSPLGKVLKGSMSSYKGWKLQII